MATGVVKSTLARWYSKYMCFFFLILCKIETSPEQLHLFLMHPFSCGYSLWIFFIIVDILRGLDMCLPPPCLYFCHSVSYCISLSLYLSLFVYCVIQQTVSYQGLETSFKNPYICSVQDIYQLCQVLAHNYIL